MTKTKIIALCIFCLLISGIILTAGYTTYEEYRQNKTYSDIGHDMLDETDKLITSITKIANTVKETIEIDIGETFNNWWTRMKEIFTDIFDGNGFGVPEQDGIGGGGGGARD